jgi:hypothetical protein
VPYCPSCRTEYQRGVKRCADCNAELVNVLPPEGAEGDETELVQLAVFPNASEARLIQEILENNGIEAVLRGDTDPIGNVTGIGPALLVEEGVLPQAREIYEAYFAGGGESDEAPAEDTSGDEDPE